MLSLREARRKISTSTHATYKLNLITKLSFDLKIISSFFTTEIAHI